MRPSTTIFTPGDIRQLERTGAKQKPQGRIVLRTAAGVKRFGAFTHSTATLPPSARWCAASSDGSGRASTPGSAARGRWAAPERAAPPLRRPLYRGLSRSPQSARKTKSLHGIPTRRHRPLQRQRVGAHHHLRHVLRRRAHHELGGLTTYYELLTAYGVLLTAYLLATYY